MTSSAKLSAVLLASLTLTTHLIAEPSMPKTWIADNGNGTYTNPLFYEEFSDPDVIRVGDNYCLAGTTMHVMPGLTVLKSKDLVNWDFASYCFESARSRSGVPSGRGQRGVRPRHLGTVHPLSRRHVLHLLEHQPSRHARLPIDVDRWAVGTHAAEDDALRLVGRVR